MDFLKKFQVWGFALGTLVGGSLSLYSQEPTRQTDLSSQPIRSHFTPVATKPAPAQPTPWEFDSDASQAPRQTRAYILTLPQDHLLGTWGGLLPLVQDRGITPSLNYEADIAGNVTGGKSQGIAYSDNIGMGLKFDLEKMAGWSGATFQVTATQRDGSSLSQNHVGNIFTIQQDYGGQTFHLIDVDYLQKFFDGQVELSLGRIAANEDFQVSPYDYLLMQNAFDGNPVGIYFNAPGMTAYPNATWGSRLKVLPTRRTYIMAGIYNGDPGIRQDYDNGANFSLDGPIFVITEAGYRLNGLPEDASQYLGNYKMGAWYDQSNYTDYTLANTSQPAKNKQGNFGVYGLFDQVVLPFAQAKSNRGLGVFGSALISPDESISQLPYFFTGGFSARGIFASRPTDFAAFGLAFGEFSEDLRASQARAQVLDPTVGLQKNETAMEWTYRFNFHRDAFYFQPDIQYIYRPGGTGQIDNALVLGTRIGINF